MTIDRGGIIAVIGDKAGAKQTASELAVLCKRRPDDIVIASPTKRVAGSLHDTTDVAIAMRTWSRRTKPTVVVIESAVGRDEDWAHEMLSALEPGITWAVVDAYRKPEDIAAWTASLGGVDALALQHLDETATPGSILGLGIPVGRIDGQRASAALWVAVLTEGVAA